MFITIHSGSITKTRAGTATHDISGEPITNGTPVGTLFDADIDLPFGQGNNGRGFRRLRIVSINTENNEICAAIHGVVPGMTHWLLEEVAE